MCSEEYWNNYKTVLRYAKLEAPDNIRDFFIKEKMQYKKVLDLGCGAGRNTELLVRLGYDVYACDYSLKMVEYTKKRLSQYYDITDMEKRITRQDMLELCYKKEKFDYVLANGVFHTLSSEEKLKIAVKQVSRIMKRDGKLYLNIFINDNLDYKKVIKVNENVYKTKNNLTVLLLSKERIIDILDENELYLDGNLQIYCMEKLDIKFYSALGCFVKK